MSGIGFEELSLLHSAARAEIDYRRGREQQVFAWTSGILVAIASAVLFADIDASALLLTTRGKCGSIAIVSVLTIGSCIWQAKHKALLAEVQSVAARSLTRTGVLDATLADETPLAPGKWKDWGEMNCDWKDLVFVTGKIQSTFALGAAAAILIWIR